MTEYFTVPEGKAPTREQVREYAIKVYNERTKCWPNMFPDDVVKRNEWVDFVYDSFMACARATVGEPLDTVPYTREMPDYGDLMTVEEWCENVECGGFIDDDGHGHPARAERIEWKEGMDPSKYPTIAIWMSDMNISPSLRHLMPKDATHVVWFNK